MAGATVAVGTGAGAARVAVGADASPAVVARGAGAVVACGAGAEVAPGAGAEVATGAGAEVAAGSSVAGADDPQAIANTNAAAMDNKTSVLIFVDSDIVENLVLRIPSVTTATRDGLAHYSKTIIASQ